MGIVRARTVPPKSKKKKKFNSSRSELRGPDENNTDGIYNAPHITESAEIHCERFSDRLVDREKPLISEASSDSIPSLAKKKEDFWTAAS